ncbi:MAG TPA: transporter substrate-binding domain-containing protein [Steroidobacteraceae bacterium]|nr:transporter substrate-binding domain-containing protein [Steroidobacteraceae bacterium]
MPAALADDLDRIIETGLVRIAVPQDLPPFGSIRNGQVEGYDVDIAKLVATELGVRLQLVPVTSVNRIPALLTDRVDLVIANLGISPDRAKTIAFSTPYAPVFSGVFGAPELVVKGPADLRGKKTAVTRHTIEDRDLTKIAPQGAEIVRFDDNDATISAFLSGKADLIATGNVVAAALLKQHPQKTIEAKFRIKQSPAGIGLRRGAPELLNWVNVFVFQSKLNGDLDRLSRQWFNEPLPELPIL